MTRRSGVVALLCGFVIFATTLELEGQTFTGGLRGAVRDTQGAIIDRALIAKLTYLFNF